MQFFFFSFCNDKNTRFWLWWGPDTVKRQGCLVLGQTVSPHLIVSVQSFTVPLCSICIWFYLLIKDVGWREWCQWWNHFLALTQQCQFVTWIQNHPILLPIPQPPTFLCSPGKLCISALGGKHYTGLAQRSVALDILAGPLPSSSSAHGQG